MAESFDRRQVTDWLRRLGCRLGWTGSGGVLLALLAGLELLVVTLPTADQTNETLAQIGRLQSGTRNGAPIAAATPSTAAAELESFEARFPARAELNAVLALVHELAARSGVELARGEYLLEREKGLGLSRYQISLPVTGPYVAIKAFMRAVLRDIPSASLDGFSLQRRSPGEEALEAVLRISVYSREAP